MVIGDLTSWI